MPPEKPPENKPGGLSGVRSTPVPPADQPPLRRNNPTLILPLEDEGPPPPGPPVSLGKATMPPLPQEPRKDLVATLPTVPLNEPDETVKMRGSPAMPAPMYGGSPTRSGSSRDFSNEASSGSRHDPAIMALLSFFVPGLGQLLMGQTFKGVALFIASYLTFWFFCAPFFVAAYDAYAIARRKNAGETVGEWQFF